MGLLTNRLRRSRETDPAPVPPPPAPTLPDAGPELLPSRAAPGAEGRLLLDGVPVRACVRAATASHIDLTVTGRPAAFAWQSETRAAFDYVDDWGVCRLVGTAQLGPPCAGLAKGERLVRLRTSGDLQRLLRRRHMRADLAIPVVLTVDGGGPVVGCTTVDLSAGGAMLDVALDVPVGQGVWFVLQLSRPIAAPARVVRFAGQGMAIEFGELAGEDRRHLELAILEAPRSDDGPAA